MASARPASAASADSSCSRAARSRSRLFSKSRFAAVWMRMRGKGPSLPVRPSPGLSRPSPARRRRAGRSGHRRSTPGRLQVSPPSGQDGGRPGQERSPIPPPGGHRRADGGPSQGQHAVRADPPRHPRRTPRRSRSRCRPPVHRRHDRYAASSGSLDRLHRLLEPIDALEGDSVGPASQSRVYRLLQPGRDVEPGDESPSAPSRSPPCAGTRCRNCQTKRHPGHRLWPRWQQRPIWLR